MENILKTVFLGIATLSLSIMASVEIYDRYLMYEAKKAIEENAIKAKAISALAREKRKRNTNKIKDIKNGKAKQTKKETIVLAKKHNFQNELNQAFNKWYQNKIPGKCLIPENISLTECINHKIRAKFDFKKKYGWM